MIVPRTVIEQSWNPVALEHVTSDPDPHLSSAVRLPAVEGNTMNKI